MKTALITGASSGIGAAFAEELAKEGNHLILVARSEAKLQQLAKQLEEKYKIQAEVIAQDLTEPTAAKTVFDAVSEKGLTVDLLINNAGFGDYGAFSDRLLAKQVEMIQLNILALVQLTHLFLAEMRDRQSGAIINVASIAAFQPLPYISVYAATKAFVLSFSEALWAENKPHGVLVLAVCPGPTESNFFQVAEFDQMASNRKKSKMFPASEVVKKALKALEKNEPTVVTGGLVNKVIANIHRFLPRGSLVNLMEKQFKPN